MNKAKFKTGFNYFLIFTVGLSYNFKGYAIDTLNYQDTIFRNNTGAIAVAPFSCCSRSNNFTQWFEFVAHSRKITIELLVGDTTAAISHTYLALWDQHYIEWDCRKYRQGKYYLSISRDDLVIGDTYLISVDNANRASYCGFYALYLDSVTNNDFKETPMSLIHSYSSSMAFHTTMNGSADGPKGSCWTSGPNYSKWYDFVALNTYLRVELKTDSIYGDIEKPYLALFDSNFNELECARFSGSSYDIALEYFDLIPGQRYRIVVDNSSQYRYVGSFTLNLFDVPNLNSNFGGALPLLDVNFHIIEDNNQVCFAADSLAWQLQYTMDGEAFEYLNYYSLDCVAQSDLETGYYRLVSGPLHSRWIFYVKIDKNEKFLIYNINGKPINEPCEGINIYVYEYNGKFICKKVGVFKS